MHSVLETDILIIPGLGDSGPGHWQTHWLQFYQHAVKVEQADWEKPEPDAWLYTLDKAIAVCSRPVVLVAHSLAVALVLHWVALQKNKPVIAALLVAPADVDSPGHTPDVVRDFAPMPLVKLPFPSIVVASTDDPYVALDRAAFFADAWGSRFVNIGAKGHINADSQLDGWPEGQRLLSTLLADSLQ